MNSHPKRVRGLVSTGRTCKIPTSETIEVKDDRSEETQELIPTESQKSWYGSDARIGWSDHIRLLLYDPRPSTRGKEG